MRCAVAVFALFAGTGVDAEPFIKVSDGLNRYEVVQSVMDSAVRECWTTLDLGASEPLDCRGDAITACVSEEPSFDQYRMRDIFCRAAAITAWEGVLDRQRSELERHFAERDQEERDGPITAPFRVPALPHVRAAWEAHRDADCGLVARQFRLGTYSMVFAQDCHLHMTIDRAIHIEKLLRGLG